MNLFIAPLIISIAIFIFAGLSWGMIINMFLWIGFIFFLPIFNSLLKLNFKSKDDNDDSIINPESKAKVKSPSFLRIMMAANLIPAFITLETLVYCAFSKTSDFVDTNIAHAMPGWFAVVNLLAPSL